MHPCALTQYGNRAHKDGACSDSFATVHDICENYKDDPVVKQILEDVASDKFMRFLFSKIIRTICTVSQPVRRCNNSV